MKILLIDSISGDNDQVENLHFQNSKIIADYLNADLIWSYTTVNDNIKQDYDIIIFNHASPYDYVDYEWLRRSPNAKLFHLTNEYNLGEPRILWMACKEGRRYNVIANHEAKISKIVKKYVDSWEILNLNSLIYTPREFEHEFNPDILFQPEKLPNCIYWGNFRKDRIKSFKKYMKGYITISTSPKNIGNFMQHKIYRKFIHRLNWSNGDLKNFTTSLYIEDEKTHTNYNYLANRFYESLMFGIVPLFDTTCENTINLSGWDIPSNLIVSNEKELIERTKQIADKGDFDFSSWNTKALEEKEDTLHRIKQLITHELELF